MSANQPGGEASEEFILRPLTGHDRRRLRTRANVLAATRELISEGGVDNLQISSVAKRAQVGVGSIYNNFSDKDALVDAVVRETLDALIRTMAPEDINPSMDPARLAANALRQFVRLAYDEPDFARLIVNFGQSDALMEGAVYPHAARVLEVGLAQQRFDVPDVHVSIVIALGGALAVMRGILAGSIGPGAEVQYAEQGLRALGLPLEESRRLADAEPER